MLEIRFTTTDIDEAKNELLVDTRSTQVASIVDFVFGHLRRYLFGIVPPRWYLNEFIKLPSLDGKFEGRRVLFQWEPCEISESCYRQLAETVCGLPGQPFEEVEVPVTLETKADYEHWAFLRALDRQHRQGSYHHAPTA